MLVYYLLVVYFLFAERSHIGCKCNRETLDDLEFAKWAFRIWMFRLNTLCFSPMRVILSIISSYKFLQCWLGHSTSRVVADVRRHEPESIRFGAHEAKF